MKTLRSWTLFWVLALATSLAISLGVPHTDFHSARGMEPIILRSVRCALPLFCVAFTASSLAILWPGTFTRWLLANRRYIGLAFAAGMAWHFGFVAFMIWSFGNPLSILSTVLDLIGFIFLLLLTLTSSQWAARRLGAANWRRIHKVGVYVIWLLATEIYLYSIQGGADLAHYLAFGALLGAWMLRVAAWAKRRLSRRKQSAGPSPATVRP